MELLADNFQVIAIFLIAGMVKGVVGMGLPTLSLALLTLITDLTSAMALMLVPSLVSNAYQSLSGGKFMAMLKKCAPFMLMAGLFVWAGAQALVRVDLPLLTGLLGMCLIVYSLVSIIGRSVPKSLVSQWWSGSAFGAVNGVLAGLTGSFVFPGVMYLQSIGLSRNELIQAMGILFAVSTLSLGFSLNHLSLISADLTFQSALGVVPAIAGMMIGSRVRNRLSETLFRRLFFAALSVIGAAIVLNAAIILA